MDNKKMPEVEIYIDGSCFGNPGPIGFAAICPIDGKVRKSCGYIAKATGTNNQAELNAAIQGLKALTTACIVTFYTDSKYLVSATQHSDKWLTQDERANHDLWMQYIKARDSGKHIVKFVKVKGHAGNKYNEMADRYAKAECAKARHQLYEND